MKKIIFTLISAAVLALPSAGYASGLVPTQCSLGKKPVVYPVEELFFTFDGAVAVAGNSVATIYFGKEAVAEGVLSVSNYTGQTWTQGCAIIKFDPPLLLPKGKTYSLVVPEGTIFREGDPSVSNDELSVEFKVPENLGPVHFDVKDGVTIDKTTGYGGLPTFYWGIETEPVGEPSFILCREGVPVREIPAYVTWDWDLGQAHPETEEGMRFEKGVHYSLVLPAGSARSMYRGDIVNEEAVFNFVGGHEEPVPPIDYAWCSMYTDQPDGTLGVVKFYYKYPVALSANPVVQLCIGEEDRVVKEAVPVLSEEENEYGRYVMTVDFEDTPLEPMKGYSIVIPEGTLVRTSGDPVINGRNEVSVGDASGVTDILSTDPDNHPVAYSLEGHIVTAPQKGNIYIQNGKKLILR